MTKQETSVVWKTVNRLWTCHYFRMNNGYFNRGNEAWRVRKLQEKQRWELRSDRGIVGHTQSLNRGGPCLRPPSCLIMTPINSFATFSSVWFVWSFIHFGLSHCFLLGCQHLKKNYMVTWVLCSLEPSCSAQFVYGEWWRRQCWW